MSSLLEGLLSYVIRVMERAVYGDNCTKYDGKISLNGSRNLRSQCSPSAMLAQGACALHGYYRHRGRGQGKGALSRRTATCQLVWR